MCKNSPKSLFIKSDNSCRKSLFIQVKIYRVILYFQPCRPIDHQLFQIWAQVAFLTDELVVGTDVHSDQASAFLIKFITRHRSLQKLCQLCETQTDKIHIFVRQFPDIAIKWTFVR